MAAKKDGDAPVVNDDAIYSVMLAKSIKVGRSMVHPGPRVRLRGDVLKAAMAADVAAVAAFEPVAS